MFRENLNEAISVNEISSFTFPRKFSLKRKLTIIQHFQFSGTMESIEIKENIGTK